ncbi:ATP-binding protein [Labilibacter marinus]|uniref:ATP-binding protein n=1 Tax=Labilibacter marinus TaxID=1477105 RepID=UPI000837614A|nr:tetratricopeptide repeat-containing sensor histidine kinase [Labilibacter marinus]
MSANRMFLLFLLVLLAQIILAQKSNIECLIEDYKKEYICSNDSLLFEISYEISICSRQPKIKLHYAELAYKHASLLNNSHWKAAAKILKSYPEVKTGKLDEGINSLLEANDLYKQVNYSLGIATCNMLLAGVYNRNEEFDLSEMAYNEAIDKFILLNDSVKLCAAVINLGEFYRKLGKKNSALASFRKSLSLSHVVGEDIYIAYSKGNIGLVYSSQNKLDSAEFYLNIAIEILQPLDDNYAVSSYLDGLAEVYFKQQKFEIAKQTSCKSLKLAQEHGLKEQIRDASLRLSTIYDHFKDFKNAFYHHKQYVAYRDSIVNEETIRNIANLTAKYDVAQKQKAVDAEKAQKESYLMITIASALIVLLLLVLAFIVLKVNRERRKSNNQLTKQHKALEKASTTKNKFFSILSHDLRSPLATFHGYSEVINLFVQHNDFKKLSVISKEIKSSSANLLDLLDNLLQWGVNQMDTLQSVSSKVSLQDVVIMEIKHLQHVSAKKDITIHTLLDENITLFVDRVKLSIAIRNLLNNAIKFTPSGRSITLSSYQEELNTIFKITDTGVGMTPVQIKSLYDFNHIESTYGTQNEKGIGLGMQLIKEFVQQSNAQIKVESQLGEGTTFKLIFKGDCENN